MFRRTLFAVVLCAMVLSTLPVFADIDFGSSARSSAMGGAGLAVLDNPLQASLINPAAMALVSRRTRFMFPSIDLRSRGAGVSRLLDNQHLVTDSDLASAIDLAQNFGTETTFLSIDAHMGIEASQISLEAGAEALAGIFPNDAFIAWAKNGTIPATPSDAKAQVTGSILTFLPEFSSGWKIPQVGGGQFYVGSRARFIHSINYTQNLQLNVAEGSSTATIVADGAETKTDDNGFAMDLGMAFRTEGRHETTYGFVADNMVHTSLKGIPQERLISVGVATRPLPKLMVAADVVNIWKAYNEPVKLRLGAEFRVARRVALRGGYSGNELTYGFGLFGCDFAFSKKTPFSISQTLAF